MGDFRVVIDGTTLNGFEPVAVRAHLARLIKKDITTAANLLSGRPTTVKEALDAATGERYLNALRSIGVACHLESDALEFDDALMGAVAAPSNAPIAVAHGAPSNEQRAAARRTPQPSSTVDSGTSVGPQLWNPNAAANWSYFLTPVFGAFLVGKNWEALGLPERAKTSRLWFIGTSVWLAVVPFLLAMKWPLSLTVVVLLGWYFLQARPQAKMVASKWGDNYSRRGWGRPLGLAVLGVIGYLFYAGFVAGLQESGGPILARLFGPTMPQCGEEDVTKLVNKLLTDSLDEQLDGKGKGSALASVARRMIALDKASIRTEGENPSGKKRDCAATLRATIPPEASSPRAAIYMTSQLMLNLGNAAAKEALESIKATNDTFAAEIQYTAQMTDDGRHIYVEVRNHVPLLLVVSAITQYAAANPNRGVPDKQSSSTETTPKVAVSASGPDSGAQANVAFESPQPTAAGTAVSASDSQPAPPVMKRQSSDLADLVKSFMVLESSRELDSTVFVASESSIAWAPPSAGGRRGRVVALVDGRPSFERDGTPGTWEVELNMNQGRVTGVVLSARPPVGLEIDRLLAAGGTLDLKPFKCHDVSQAASLSTYVYEVRAADRAPAWLAVDNSCGSGGCLQSIAMIYSRFAALKTPCQPKVG